MKRTAKVKAPRTITEQRPDPKRNTEWVRHGLHRQVEQYVTARKNLVDALVSGRELTDVVKWSRTELVTEITARLAERVLFGAAFPNWPDAADRDHALLLQVRETRDALATSLIELHDDGGSTSELSNGVDAARREANRDTWRNLSGIARHLERSYADLGAWIIANGDAEEITRETVQS